MINPIKCWYILFIFYIKITVVPGKSRLAAFSASLRRGPEHGHPGSNCKPILCDIKCADSKPPTTKGKTLKNSYLHLITHLVEISEYQRLFWVNNNLIII